MTAPARLAAITLWFVRRRLARRPFVVRTPRIPLVALAIATATLLATAALGPSAAVEPLPGHPPFGWHAHPSAALVTALLAITAIAGSYGVLGCLGALKRGWALDTKRLLIAAFLATVALGLLAPVGSSDPGSYAAYGRLAATGHDPYVTPPSALTDSYRAIAEPPWQSTTSVYGPLATGEQWVAAKIAGDGAHAAAHAVFILGIVNALAFIVTGLLLQRLAPGQAGRRRAAVFFSANPLLLFEGVSGAHIDVVVTLFVVAAIAAIAARPGNRFAGWLTTFGAGVLAGAAVAIKAAAALAAAALACWAAGWLTAPWRSLGLSSGHAIRRSARRGWSPFTTGPRTDAVRLAIFVAGAAAVLVPGYLLAGAHAFDQLRHASGFVSFADPWRIVTHPLESGLGHDRARAFVRVAAWVAFAIFVLLLDHGLPGRRAESPPRAVLVLTLAWLLTAPYVLPWYAIVAVAALALLPASGFDRLLVFWIAVLALAYLPGRQVMLPGWVHGPLDVWKSGISPVLLLATSVLAALLSLRARQQA
jgi:hypothetical protein